MNKKQRVLTIIMLVAAICLLALLIRNEVAIPLAISHHYQQGSVEVMDWGLTRSATFLVMLGVIYAGLFFVLAGDTFPMDLLLIFFGALIVIFGFSLSAIPLLATVVVIVGAAICLYGLILNRRSHRGR
jgi:hypothetical protein